MCVCVHKADLHVNLPCRFYAAFLRSHLDPTACGYLKMNTCDGQTHPDQCAHSSSSSFVLPLSPASRQSLTRSTELNSISCVLNMTVPLFTLENCYMCNRSCWVDESHKKNTTFILNIGQKVFHLLLTIVNNETNTVYIWNYDFVLLLLEICILMERTSECLSIVTVKHAGWNCVVCFVQSRTVTWSLFVVRDETLKCF